MYSAYWLLSHRETNIYTHGHTKAQFRLAEWPCKQGFRMCEGATVLGENTHKYRENMQTPHIKTWRLNHNLDALTVQTTNY